MAGFVLIHGAMHGGWCFDPVAQLLGERGHVVAAPGLPGMGGTEAELRAVTLEGWGAFALGQCREVRAAIGDAPLVLAGHSRGGLVVSAAAEADPGAMDALGYICAMMPAPAHGEEAVLRSTPPNPGLKDHIRSVENGAGILVDRARAGEFFAHLSPPDLVAEASRRLAAEPVGPLASRFVPTEARWGSLPRTYVECLEDRTMLIASQRAMIEAAPGTRVITLDCDHSPFYSAPEALADALEAMA